MSTASDAVAAEIDQLKTQAARLLALLSDGAWHESTELAEVAGYRYGGRIFDLREAGHEIERQKLGPRRHFYRIRPKDGQGRLF